jgi:hypothetical protein
MHIINYSISIDGENVEKLPIWWGGANDAFLFMVSFVPLAFGLASVYALYLMYFS